MSDPLFALGMIRCEVDGIAFPFRMKVCPLCAAKALLDRAEALIPEEGPSFKEFLDLSEKEKVDPYFEPEEEVSDAVEVNETPEEVEEGTEDGERADRV
jgi:hypothetical protein